MPNIFIATLGQRPEAITVALDLLSEDHTIDQVVIVHTDAKRSAIDKAHHDLQRVMEADYPDLPVAYHEVRTQQNTPLIDIIDENTASDYFRAIYRVLLQHKRNGDTLHLLIAGGRKSMSVYAALAAALIFRQHDCLWHVVSASRDIEVPGQFHIPPESRADVYLVAMPLVPTRAVVWDMPPEYIDDPMKRVADAQDVRNGFLRLLTNAERELALFVEEHPDRDAERIGQELTISPSTVNNHLGNIYNKLSGYLELPRDESPRKHTPKMKQMLLRLLGGKL